MYLLLVSLGASWIPMKQVCGQSRSAWQRSTLAGPREEKRLQSHADNLLTRPQTKNARGILVPICKSAFLHMSLDGRRRKKTCQMSFPSCRCSHDRKIAMLGASFCKSKSRFVLSIELPDGVPVGPAVERVQTAPKYPHDIEWMYSRSEPNSLTLHRTSTGPGIVGVGPWSVPFRMFRRLGQATGP
ncbi:hypothetical protein PISMIDRAFT_604581 [Pisolithus microcarpus 441]|uniref:Uncharacterized protein n=1 Tax=Pisolithus microcarpus 441 TaxID=765257 RepID=A0A0C9YEH4_9AGAM|nr:hypothetical protein PISMIDRAFT_457483 [Pisolithus microcarpus 441]KIK28083.1 hypothetical protein PISMIDRAFT_604581 [Pisolithus microcarpus 441]